MKKKFIILLLFVSLCLWAQIPQTIDYQGRIADSDGNYLNEVVTLDFLIYNMDTGGTVLWTETQDVNCTNGVFHVQLGAATPLPGTLFSIADPWLELVVGGETLSPRTAIASVPYAVKAETAYSLDAMGSGSGLDADLLDGFHSTYFMPASTTWGDITAVTAGTGLNGGGTTGDVTVNVDVPLVLTGAANGVVVGFATSGYGVYGGFDGANWAYMGDDNYGIYAELYTTNTGNYAIYGDGTDSDGEDGTGYDDSETLGGVKGYNFYGNPYTFGVAGYSYLDYGRSGATFGGRSWSASSLWGCLAYYNSGGSSYGAYWTNSGSGSGDNLPSIGIGMGSWGDLFGADIHGNVYGTFTEGENYALYSSGTVFKNDLDVHLQKTESSNMSVLYTNVSTDVTVQTSGYVTLSSGRCDITFDENFSSIVSDDIPIVVTVTPVGQSEGVYIEQVDKNGFSIVENNNARSSVQVSFIAIGRRAGYENPQLPAEVVAADYTDKLARGLHNDADTETDGEGLYYENGQLNVGKHYSTLPDPNKPAEPQE